MGENFDCAAYVLGIASIVFGVFLPVSGVILGIIGLVLAKRQKTILSKRANKFSTMGIVVGVIMYLLNWIMLSKFTELGGSFPA